MSENSGAIWAKSNAERRFHGLLGINFVIDGTWLESRRRYD